MMWLIPLQMVVHHPGLCLSGKGKNKNTHFKWRVVRGTGNTVQYFLEVIIRIQIVTNILPLA
jgi:hypothetical protein